LLDLFHYLPPSCTVVMRSGNLNFLEPSGPLQASNGTDLMLNITGSDILAGAVEVSCAVMWQLAVHAQSSHESWSIFWALYDPHYL